MIKKSSTQSGGVCATRLDTEFIFGNVWGVKPRIVEGEVSEAWVPAGCSLTVKAWTLDTSIRALKETGMEESGNWKYTSERSRYPKLLIFKIQDAILESAVEREMRREHPELFDFSDLDLENFGAWFSDFQKKAEATATRLIEENPSRFIELISKKNLITEGRSGGRQSYVFRKPGYYQAAVFYGYDINELVDSYVWGMQAPALWYVSKIVVELMSWFGPGFAAKIATKLAKGVGIGMKVGKGGKLVLSKGGLVAVGGAYVAEGMAHMLPHGIPYVAPKTTRNHNQCKFPDGGFTHLVNCYVYDKSKTDSHGNPICKDGFQFRDGMCVPVESNGEESTTEPTSEEPSSTPTPSNIPLYVGLGIGAAVLIGMLS